MNGRRYLALAATVLITAGCQTESVTTSDGRPMPPPPRAMPEAPAGIVPARMLLIVGQRADDSDGNGYPDVIHLSIGLFGATHPLAIEAAGTIVIQLYTQGDFGRAGATPIAEWIIPIAPGDGQATRKPWGTGYDLSLSLIKVGTDRMPSTAADVRGAFIPANTEDVVTSSDEVRPIRIGRG